MVMSLAIRRTPCGYQESTTTSPWSPWTEPSSGLSTSCATREPSTFVWQLMTSPGTSTTLWTCLDSCLPVCWLWCSSSQSVASFATRDLLTLERSRKGSSWSGKHWHKDLLQCITAGEAVGVGSFILWQDSFSVLFVNSRDFFFSQRINNFCT